MQKIKARYINAEEFKEFGTFYDMSNPTGYGLKGEIHQFFPDRITVNSLNPIAFSPITVKKEDVRIIKAVEYHTTTPELILPLNDDMIIHVAPASAGTVIPEFTKAFIVPQGTMVKINTAIWHLAPLPLKEAELVAMIVLPECTYVNDCTVVELKEEEKMEIVVE